MKTIKGILGWVLPVIIGLAIALLVKQFFFTVARVDGPSMEPNLINNERIMVWRQADIKRGSVVVFNAAGVDPQAAKNDGLVKDILGTNGTDYVKRVIAVPGDTVAFKDGAIYVNNHKIDQSYIGSDEQKTGSEYNMQPGNWDLQSLSRNWKQNQGAVKVPKGQYFVMGDHRSVSNDSRYWGFVPKDKIIGVVKTFPWDTTKQQRENINDRD
ncbi:signal peptidase I [Fructilactobacillus frigidiflavus]|uniref:signal peptidase I n=1 Tax=Fructilactobacillus frigidiflavus TaxID=3242688 RepID=UPI003756AEB4